MVADYEAAWVELQQLVASKTQHGRDGLLASMADIAAKHRVPAGELSRLLRLYGVEVERARSIAAESDPAVDGASRGDSLLARMAGDAGHHRPGGHDVRRSNGREATRG